MSFDLRVIKQFSGSNASILKLQCKFTPDITIIPAIFDKPYFKIAIVAPLIYINKIRAIIEKFKCIYQCFAFYTQDGTCIRHVEKNDFIGKGNVNGFDENNFGKIFIPNGFDKVIIILNNHRSTLSVIKDKIKSDLELDFNKLNESCMSVIKKGTESIDLFVDYYLLQHLKSYELEYLTNIFSKNINVISISRSIQDYCIRFICETYFGLLESIINKGVNIELNIDNLIYYITEADPLNVKIAYNDKRKTFSLVVNSDESIEFDVILFLTQNINEIIPYSGIIKKNITIIESEYNQYSYLDGNELERLLDLLQNLDIPNISRFNVYEYKFTPIPLFKLNPKENTIPAIEFKYLLDYMWKRINEEEMKNNKNGYQTIFGISKKMKIPAPIGRFSSNFLDIQNNPNQLYSLYDNNSHIQ